MLLPLCFCTSCKKNEENTLPKFGQVNKDVIFQNYKQFVDEISQNPDKIPMIVHTDQHGLITKDCELYSYLNQIVDWSRISRIINLGDTVYSSFNTTELDEYFEATKMIPEEKRIEVIGNHDHLGKEGGPAQQYFQNHVSSNIPYNFVDYDETFNIRYLTVDLKIEPWSYNSGFLSSEKADFILNELEKTDTSNILFLSHAYLFYDEVIDRNGGIFTGSENFIGDREHPEVRNSFLQMLNARKTKTSGILLDSEGNEHSYNFENVNSELLMSLHGHHHKEGYETKDNFTQFLFQSLRFDEAENTEPYCFYFAYVDPTAKTFKCWKNIQGYKPWSISFA